MAVVSTYLDRHFSCPTIPKKLQEDVNNLKSWLEKQHHLPLISDRQLAVFFNCNQESTERTKKFLENYFTIRTHAPDLFSDRNVEEFRQISEFLNLKYLTKHLFLMPSASFKEKKIRTVYLQRHVNVLNGKTTEGYKVEVIALRDFNINKFSLSQSCKYMFAVSDIAAQEYTDIRGWRILMNMQGFTLAHFLKFHPAVVKKCILYVQEALPLYLKSIHVFNAVALVHQILAMVRPIMKKEVFDLIRIHTPTEVESLHAVVPQELLPSDFGGKDYSMEKLNSETLKKMESYSNWFLEEEKYRVDESKRLGCAKDPSEIFGIDGSFRRLSID